MQDITHPLRLARGSHQAGSGKGCAMNIVSWENGDVEITDFPECSSPLLSLAVQTYNDNVCTHTDNTEDEVTLLCPECSVKALALGHRTVGTAELHTTEVSRRMLMWILNQQIKEYSRSLSELVEVDSAESLVHHYARNLHRVTAWRELVIHYYGRRNADVFVNAQKEIPDLVGLQSLLRSGDRERSDWSLRVECAYINRLVDPDMMAMPCEDDDNQLYAAAMIDKFEELTGAKAPAPDPAKIAEAYQKMLVTS